MYGGGAARGRAGGSGTGGSGSGTVSEFATVTHTATHTGAADSAEGGGGSGTGALRGGGVSGSVSGSGVPAARGRSIPPSSSNDLEEAIKQKLEELQSEWRRNQRASAPPIITANQTRINEWAQARTSSPCPWPQAGVMKTAIAFARGGTPDLPQVELADGQDGSTPRDGTEPALKAGRGDAKLTERKSIGVKIARGGGSVAMQRVTATVLPSAKTVPNFVSWAYLKHNELAPDHGKRMFYTDPGTGETVPDSDDEGDTKPWQTRKGPEIDYALKGVAHEYGQGMPVISALASALGTTTKAVTERLATLVATQPSESARQSQEVDDVLDAMFGHFCRRCRIFNCRLHGKIHVRPNEKPRPPPPPPDGTPPCGPECWRRDTKLRAMMEDAERQQRDEDKAEAARHGGAAAGSSGAAGASAAAAAGDDTEMADAADEDETAEDGKCGGGGGGEVSGGEGGGIKGGKEGVSIAAAAVAAGAKAAAASEAWTTWELSLFSKAQVMYGTDCCAIARLLGSRSCREVAASMAAARALGEGIGEASARRNRRKSRSRHRKAQLKPPTAKSNTFKKRLGHRENELWPEYIACNCKGSCNAEYCSCHRDQNFCEKYCACSIRCSNRFRGCNCRGQCRTRQCPCLAAGRECDPDLCHNCTATCDGSAAPGTECLNMKLRLRQHLRVSMGRSTVQGWGAFLQGSCNEDDFLGEYTGDLITQEEADRRGRIYDRMNNSYLFNLNEQWVLDARHRGNKFRFANHSPKPNCKVRLMMVDGDWRVAVFANRNIKPNEELFYDYRYDEDVSPEWANNNKK